MRLTHLGLTNFRTYRRLDLTLTPGVTLLVGDNAQGKTALLEAIYYLATSRGAAHVHDRELVNWGAADEPLPFARVAGEIQRHDRGVHVEIVVVEPPGSGRPLEKRVKIDGVARRALDLLGQVNVVFFSPDDIELVSDGPAVRRHYLDATLCQIDPRYCHALGQYRRVLAQRNHLLHVIQEGRGRRDELGFWDDLLIEHGSVITARRYALLRRLETWGTLIYGDLTGGQDALRVNYRPSALVSQSDRPTERGAVEAAQALLGQESLTAADVAAVFRERLAARAAAEIARGATLVGPHRDDFQLLGGEIDLHIYGSRGQQRTAALALKLGEIEAMHEATQERPVLLLDDVMSELDAPRRAYVAGRVAQYEQTLATATDWSDFSPPLQAQATCLVVRGGTVSPRRSDG